jgi:hypothetical protein
LRRRKREYRRIKKRRRRKRRRRRRRRRKKKGYEEKSKGREEVGGWEGFHWLLSDTNIKPRLHDAEKIPRFLLLIPLYDLQRLQYVGIQTLFRHTTFTIVYEHCFFICIFLFTYNCIVLLTPRESTTNSFWGEGMRFCESTLVHNFVV